MQAPICLPFSNTPPQFYTISSCIEYIKELSDYAIIAFGKAYINYLQFDAFTKRNIFYVTRHTGYTSMEEFALPDDAQHIFKRRKD